MGGLVNVAIRFRDGRIVCQERWTNNMPYFFRNPKMYSGDEKYVQDYIDMTRGNDYVNTDVPGRPEPLRNNEYGLIVWDYMTNQILDNNHYAPPTYIDILTASMHEEEVNACINILRLEKRVKLHRWVNGKKEFPSADIVGSMSDILTEQQVREKIATVKSGEDSEEENSWFYETFIIDTSPMTYLAFPKREFADFEAKLIELGFPMNGVVT